MLIKVEDLIASGEGTPRAKFSSDHGTGLAYWRSELPEVGKEYDVEFEIEDNLVWDETILPTDLGTNRLGEFNDGVLLMGKIESVEEDGCVVIKIGSSVILLGTINMPTAYRGFVQVRAKEASVYCTNM